MKYMEAFKVESNDGIINLDKMKQKMNNKIEQYKNLLDKLDNINTDFKSG